LARGIISYWPLNGGITQFPDLVTGNTLVNAGTLSWGPGFFGAPAVISAGNNSLVEASTGPANMTNLGGGPVTVGLWFRYSSRGSSQALTQKYRLFSGSVNEGWKVLFDGSALSLTIYYSTTNLVLTTTASVLSANQWHQVFVTWKGTSAANAHIYVDGVEAGYATQTSAGGTASGETTAAGFKIRPGAGSVSFSVDHAAFWTRQLAAAEVSQINREPFAFLRTPAPGIHGSVIAGTAPQTYNLTMSGGALLLGSAGVADTYSPSMTGGTVAGGAAATAATYNPSVTGGVLLADSATPAATYAPSMTGGVDLVGVAAPPTTYSLAATGSVVVEGAAGAGNAVPVAASGGGAVSGSAPPGFALGWTMPGGIQLAGSAGPSTADYGPIASGGVVAGGDAGLAYAAGWVATGGVLVSGSAGTGNVTAFAMSGGVHVEGGASPTAAYHLSGLGGIELLGAAGPGTIYNPAMTGHVQVAGSSPPGYSFAMHGGIAPGSSSSPTRLQLDSALRLRRGRVARGAGCRRRSGGTPGGAVRVPGGTGAAAEGITGAGACPRAGRVAGGGGAGG
jgi:hypothetical protein